MVEIGAATNWRQQLWCIAENGPNAGPKPAGEHEHVNRVQTIAIGGRNEAHAPLLPWNSRQKQGFGAAATVRPGPSAPFFRHHKLPTDIRNMLAPRRNREADLADSSANDMVAVHFRR